MSLGSKVGRTTVTSGNRVKRVLLKSMLLRLGSVKAGLTVTGNAGPTRSSSLGD